MDSNCPDCGSQLVVRARRCDGKSFIGCSGFPNCSYSSALESEAKLPNTGLDAEAFRETDMPIREVAVRCITSKDKDKHALGCATLILLDYIALWRNSGDPHAWDSLDLAAKALKQE
jgi:ssDNA-binding Zn-finger/Zn-ribbon topoisomerase 1